MEKVWQFREETFRVEMYNASAYYGEMGNDENMVLYMRIFPPTPL
jgi:hypothetical protein